jgi:hypothetical protein
VIAVSEDERALPESTPAEIAALVRWTRALVEATITSHTVGYHEDSIGWQRDSRDRLRNAWTELLVALRLQGVAK